MKKKPLKYKVYGKSKRKRNLVVMLLLGSCISVWGFFWWLSQLGPQKVDFRSFDRSIEETTDIEELLKKSIEFEEKFEATSVGGSEAKQDLTLLKSAVDLQTQYLDALPGYDSVAAQRLQRLERCYQDASSAQLKVISFELEAEAREFAEALDYPAASKKYNEAFELQQSINKEYPMSSASDAVRAVRLQRQAQQLAFKPLLQESFELEKQAERSIDENDIESASNLLNQAITVQEKLNREYRGMFQSDVHHLEKLKEKLAGIESIHMYSEIEQVLERVAMLKAGEDLSGVADLYREAERLQESLNKTYPKSPYASSGRLKEFQKEGQGALSVILWRKIEKKNIQLEQSLAGRNIQKAVQLITELGSAIRQMKDEFPLSSFNDPKLQGKIDYLDQMQFDLASIHEQIYNALLPVAGIEGVKIFRTEVPQELYARIIGKNPSRNRGDRNPVDSISWTEATVFCERVSWILGKKVRLPSEAEFRRAADNIHLANPDEYIWSASNADGSTQAVGQKNPLEGGYHDLLGNVSEWLNQAGAHSDSRSANHIGGHAQDATETVLSLPVRSASRNERNRLTGFRFVVVH